MGLLMNRNFPHGTFPWDFLVTTLYQIGQSQVEVARGLYSMALSLVN